MPPTPEHKVLLTPDVLSQALIGETILLNLKTDEYYALDEVGARTLAVLVGADSIRAAVEALMMEYEVDAVRLERDVLDLVDKLVQHGLVEVRGR